MSQDALPPDLPASGPSRLLSYIRYPAFTWPWFVRRAYVFWPIALVMGLAYGAWHASSMATWDEFAPLAWRAVAADLVIVSAAPALGAFVRQLRLPYLAERILVVLAFAAGLVVAFQAAVWASDYHEFLMGHDHAAEAASGSFDLNWLLGVILGDAPDWIILALLGGGLELIAYFSERRRLEAHAQSRALAAARRERDEADARLAVLQAQIEPHFLFNTLASIRFLVRTDPEQAAATIDALSNYLRTTLPKLRADASMETSTLGEQIDVCAGYLELMEIRMGGRLDFRVEAPDDLRRLAFPPLILLTLVENAIKHGIEPKAGKGTILIRAGLAGGTLEVVVEDDGAGLKVGEGSGLGLANVHAQLKNRYGDLAAFDLAAGRHGGALATVKTPAEAA